MNRGGEMLKKFALLTVLLGGMSLPAQATTVTYLITGVIYFETAATLQVGDAMTATVTVDFATPDSGNLTPGLGVYEEAVVSASFSLGGTRIGTGSSLSVLIGDDVNGQDGFEVFHSSSGSTTYTASFEGEGLADFFVDLSDSEGTAFNSVALQVPTDVAPFEFTLFYFLFPGNYIEGNVTSIQVVPEPSIAALLGAGALAFARRRRA
jgi:hypothetical protein